MNNSSIIQQAIRLVMDRQHLSREIARSVMSEMMDGAATPAQIGSLLTAIQMKGETIDEVIGFAEIMRDKSSHVKSGSKPLLDTCGTGGDGAHTFNISTTAAIVAAAGGVRVAKHGNRAMSSKSGSADVLEALGVHIGLNAEQATLCLQQIGICFMFAQNFHPSMKYVALPRKELGFRTIFNWLGPLTNPAQANCQVLGVYDRHKTEFMAQALLALGVERALVVASFDGLDEISVSAETQMTELVNRQFKTYTITPDILGIRSHELKDIQGGDARMNAEIIQAIFSGEKGAYRDIVLANTSASFYITERCATLQEGVKLAAHVIDSGLAQAKLNDLIQLTGELNHVS
jgi:anthranilate phosphoribosyltransferase